MKQLKKTLLTLVALLAVTTGAWADETLLLTIESKDNTSFKDGGSKTFDDKVIVTFSSSVRNDGDGDGWYGSSVFSSLLTVTGTNEYTITSCKFYTAGGIAATGYTVVGESPSVYLSEWTVFTDASKSVSIGEKGITKIEVYTAAASSGPEVAWDEDKNSGSFKMPGGNVTLEPEYYPQATVADGGVTAADADARATTDDPLVKVDATKLTGAKKLMYFVSNSGTAPAYDAEGWTDQLPTAEGFTQQGIVYVWYYPVGTDEGVDGATATYSDGDICLESITARIADAPTYAVTFAEGVNPAEPAQPEWTASPNAGVTKGTPVTVTYTGTKKVLGVKAEKKSASTPLDNTTTAWSAGTFVVPAGGLTYSDAITVSGDVTLVLTDGETLTLNKGISLAEGATLTIQGNGTMNVKGTNNSTASTVAGSTGTLILTSGTLTATGGKGQDVTDAEQTGASGGAAINGSVTVNGGSLTAKGGNGGNCIGATIGPETNGGAGGAAISGDVTITDGAVAATGGNGGSIGASNFGMEVHGGAGGAAIGGNATLTGGTLTTTQGANGTKTGNVSSSSVGTGGKAVAGTMTNNGGTVNQ